jgi:hypothetical protein
MDPYICCAEVCELSAKLQQGFIEVWRVEDYLVEAKRVESFPV